MKIFADLHLHSKFSRACSKNLDLENLSYWGKYKGLNLIGTGDFTHPLWFQELKEKLEPTSYGFYRLKNSSEKDILFALSCEISFVFPRKQKIKKIHSLFLFPSLEDVEKFNKKISLYGNLASDGRPTLELDIMEIIKIAMEINEKAIIIPAHIWTPWFSLFGSMSGFDSLNEAFGDYLNYISAVETGLSSNPPMNWRLSQLDNLSIVSFSDSHSPYPHRLGREAVLFEMENFSYDSLWKALKEPDDKNKIVLTIEFFPEEGKYHYDGHRKCRLRFSPEESKKNNYLCPLCYKKVTIGVMSRVELLADRPVDYFDPQRPSYKNVIPLTEIIAEALNSDPTSKKVLDIYFKILNKYENEFNFFLNPGDYFELKNMIPNEVLKAIDNFFNDKIKIEPGYDGEYGVIKILEEKELVKGKINKDIKKLF